MKVCTCVGSCKGPETLGANWTCALSEEYRRSMERIEQYACEDARGKEATDWVAMRDQLQAENDRLRNALAKIVKGIDCGCGVGIPHIWQNCPWHSQEVLMQHIEWIQKTAREAV